MDAPTGNGLKPAACLIGQMPGLQSFLQTRNLKLSIAQLVDQESERFTRPTGNALITLIFDDLNQFGDIAGAQSPDKSGDKPEFATMPAKRMEASMPSP